MVRRIVLAVFLAASLAGAPAAAAQPRPAQEEFVPVTGAETEQLPAARLVMIAYAAAWLFVFLYIWSLWRRLAKVERELAELAAEKRK